MSNSNLLKKVDVECLEKICQKSQSSLDNRKLFCYMTEDEYIEEIKNLKEKLKRKEELITQIEEAKDEEFEECESRNVALMDELKQFKIEGAKQHNEMEQLKTELEMERIRIRKLENDILEMQFNSKETKAIDLNGSSDSSSFNENKEKVLQAKLSSVERDLRLCEDQNAGLLSRMQEMEEVYEDTIQEVEELRELNKIFRKERDQHKETILELESKLHSMSVPNLEMAKQGNSLFGEVIEGREKQEQEMLVLFREKERFRAAYEKTMKMLRDSTMKVEENFCNRDVLTGSTLAVFKRIKTRLRTSQNENERLKERIASLESDLLDSELNRLNGNSSEKRLQCQFIQDELNLKKRLESQIRELVAENHDLCDKILAESSRAAAIPSLEHRIDVLSKVIAQLERDKNFGSTTFVKKMND